jgi:hypothetical protein
MNTLKILDWGKRRRAVVGKKASSFTQRIEVRPFDCRWVAYHANGL